MQDESVTRWIGQVKDGDSVAARSLWEHYFSQLVDLARQKLRNSGADRRVADEEDVALSVLNKFFQSAQKGRYPDLSDRSGLWRLLIKMTANKAVDLRRQQSRVRRGGDQSQDENAAVHKGRPASDDLRIAEFMAKEPTPEMLAIMADQLANLLTVLGDPDLQELVICKIEGYTNEEMAQRMNVTTRTIERRLRLVREHCREELDRD